MDRIEACRSPTDLRCPHACGDGPKTGDKFMSLKLLSPRLWGWTEHAASLVQADKVVPTPVGMDQRSGAKIWPKSALSPRLWGWTSDNAI